MMNDFVFQGQRLAGLGIQSIQLLPVLQRILDGIGAEPLPAEESRNFLRVWQEGDDPISNRRGDVSVDPVKRPQHQRDRDHGGQQGGQSLHEQALEVVPEHRSEWADTSM